MPHNKTTLEDICVSLELAKELKSKGYPQESLFYWQDDEILINPFDSPRDLRKWLSDYGDPISAPTASELGEKLKELKGEELPKYYNGDWFFFVLTGKFAGAEEITSDTEANARAKMWLYLKKEGLI